MKNINQDALNQFAKEKNIDKNKIEEIADSYKGKSENELLDELISIGKHLKGKEEVISKIKPFMDDKQKAKLDMIMDKISQAQLDDVKTKTNSAKSSVQKKVKTKKVKKIQKRD